MIYALAAVGYLLGALAYVAVTVRWLKMDADIHMVFCMLWPIILGIGIVYVVMYPFFLLIEKVAGDR